MMKFTTLISVFLVLLISTNLFSATNIKDDNPEIFKLINETSIDSAYIKSGAVILLKESYTQISNEGLSYSTLHVIGKILDKKAKQDYSQIPIFFNSFYCDISMEYARTIKPDGTIISVSQDAVQIKDYPSTEAITYTDEKFLSFSLPGLDIGTAFEYKIIYQDKKNVVENNWLEGYSFYNVLHSVIPPYIPRIDPIIKSIQVLDVPRGEKFQIALDNITIDTEKSTTDKYDRYTWQAENMPAFKIDYGMPYLYDQLPYLRLTSIDSWEIVGKWAYQKIMTKAEITEEIKSLASDLTNAKETEEQKIESIYEFIQNKIDYVQSDLMRSGYMPHYSYETLTNKYGDCKDQATLLIALLRAINIDAYPALLNTAYHGKTRLDFPNPYFNHLIVYIPGMSKKGIWLDTTSDVTPFNRLLSSNMDCEAFIVKKENSEFIKTPTSELSVNFSDASINFDFYDDTIKTRINIEANGSLGDFYKSMFLHTTDEEKSNFVNDFLYNFNKNRKNDYYKFYNIDDNHFPFKLEISFTNDDVWQRSLFFFTFGPHSYFSIPLFFGFESLPLPENRQQDLQLSTIANVKNRETYPPPTADFTANLLPDNYEFSSQYIDFSKDFSYQGDSVIVDWHLALKKSLIKAKDYKEFYSDVQNIIKQINWQVKFSRKFEVFNLPKKEEEQEEQQKFRISAIVVASETEARDILGKLKQGSEFKELAAKYSIGPGKDNGGDLGYFNEGDLFDVLDEAAKPLEKGQMSDVIKTSTGYFIIQKTDILQQKEIEEIANFENLIEQAKKEIKSKQYEKSLDLLENALKLQPENPEVNYLLGYNQLMINFPGASSIETLDRSTAEKSIKYLKNVIRITPKYDGEIFDKDPYSLLSKVYGALALSYLLNSKTDSMKWAFKEGTNSGAFSKSKLEFYQNTLLSCSENSLLFTENDYHYYNFLYLQQINKIRTDITVINISFLDYSWYVLSLKYDLDNLGFAPILLDDKYINNSKSKYFDAFEFQIPVDNDIMNVMGKIKWTYKQNTNNKLLPFRNVVFLNILESNKWKKNIYFAFFIDSTQYLGLHNYISIEGLASPLKTHKTIPFPSAKIIDNIKNVYTFNELSDSIIYYSTDLAVLLNLYRAYVYMPVLYQYKDMNSENFDFIAFLGNFDKAEESLPNDLLPQPDSFKNLISPILAATHVYYKRYDDFSNVFNKMKQSSSAISTLRDFANIFRVKEHYNEAQIIYKKIIESDLANSWDYRRLANCFESLNNHDKAIENFLKAIELDSDNAYLYNDLAYSYMSNKDYSSSIINYKKSLKLNPDYANSWGNLGWLYYLTNDFEKSIQYSEKAVELDPNALYARYNISLAYLKSGDTEKATALYKETKEFNLSIQDDIYQGAINDLKNLIKQKILVNESENILKNVFNVEITNPGQ